VEGQGGAMDDWDIEFIKTVPVSGHDTSSTTITTNGTFGFSALMIPIILGYY